MVVFGRLLTAATCFLVEPVRCLKRYVARETFALLPRELLS